MRRAASPPDSPETARRDPVQLVSRTVPEVDPLQFLTLFEGQPRGMWSRGDDWVVHGGVAAEIRLGQAEIRLGQSEDSTVARLKALIARRPMASGARFFGGLAFRGDGPSGPPWDAFGAARFQSPEVVLERSAHGCVLQVAVPSAAGPAPQGVLEAWADRLVSSMDGARHDSTTDQQPRVQSFPGEKRHQDLSVWLVDEPGQRARWTRMVQRALNEIAASRLEKVVLARSMTRPAEAHPLAAVARLRDHNPKAWTFMFEPQAGRVFLGASPESLAVLRGDSLTASAVAGSRPRGATRQADQEQGRALLDSAKDRREHEFVARGMVRRLESLTRSIHPAAEPRLLSLSGIHHLETLIHATCVAGTGVLDVVDALHPTAAVCGSPQPAAQAFITREEDFDRGWYGGPVGWFDDALDGVFVPALRCALLDAESWHLFAGAGIVEGSDPHREWEETSLKFETALSAMSAGSGDG